MRCDEDGTTIDAVRIDDPLFPVATEVADDYAGPICQSATWSVPATTASVTVSS